MELTREQRKINEAYNAYDTLMEDTGNEDARKHFMACRKWMRDWCFHLEIRQHFLNMASHV